MIVFPNCKINLGLQVLQKREDGYHNLETIFYPIALNDALEITRSSTQHQDPIQFNSTGLLIEGDSRNNLCIKAYQLLKKDFPTLPPIQMHLHKTIPMGAGLGGGSSDGAFTLSLLNDLFKLGLSTDSLLQYALQLGSDCPFFILNQAALGMGRGEQLEPIELDLSGYWFVIVNPGIHINTGWAFNQLHLSNIVRPSLKAIIDQPIAAWKDQLINDFEAPVTKAQPEIASIKEKLYDEGAVYAAMTGSGSTVFGLFTRPTKPVLDFPNHYFVKVV